MSWSDLLCDKLSSSVFNLVDLEVVGLSESPHLGHDVINVVLVGLDVILQQLCMYNHTSMNLTMNQDTLNNIIIEVHTSI